MLFIDSFYTFLLKVFQFFDIKDHEKGQDRFPDIIWQMEPGGYFVDSHQVFDVAFDLV